MMYPGDAVVIYKCINSGCDRSLYGDMANEALRYEQALGVPVIPWYNVRPGTPGLGFIQLECWPTSSYALSAVQHIMRERTVKTLMCHLDATRQGWINLLDFLTKNATDMLGVELTLHVHENDDRYFHFTHDAIVRLVASRFMPTTVEIFIENVYVGKATHVCSRAIVEGLIQNTSIYRLNLLKHGGACPRGIHVDAESITRLLDRAARMVMLEATFFVFRPTEKSPINMSAIAQSTCCHRLAFNVESGESVFLCGGGHKTDRRQRDRVISAGLSGEWRRCVDEYVADRVAERRASIAFVGAWVRAHRSGDEIAPLASLPPDLLPAICARIEAPPAPTTDTREYAHRDKRVCT